MAFTCRSEPQMKGHLLVLAGFVTSEWRLEAEASLGHLHLMALNLHLHSGWVFLPQDTSYLKFIVFFLISCSHSCAQWRSFNFIFSQHGWRESSSSPPQQCSFYTSPPFEFFNDEEAELGSSSPQGMLLSSLCELWLPRQNDKSDEVPYLIFTTLLRTDQKSSHKTRLPTGSN